MLVYHCNKYTCMFPSQSYSGNFEGNPNLFLPILIEF